MITPPRRTRSSGCMCSDTSEENVGESCALVRSKGPAIKALEIEKPSSSSSSSSSTPTEHAAWLKWASLGLLVFQNSGVFLMMRYTRAVPGPLYLTTVTVWLAEFFKGLVCTVILLASHLRDGGWSGFAAQVHEEIWVQRRETLRLAVPAACYTVQNNLLYLAVTHMSAAGSQVLYQSTSARAKCPAWLCPSPAPAAPQGAPGGSGQLGAPRVRPQPLGVPPPPRGSSSELPPFQTRRFHSLRPSFYFRRRAGCRRGGRRAFLRGVDRARAAGASVAAC